MPYNSEELKEKGLGILIVDDESHIRFLVGEALKGEGRTIHLAASGRQAIALLEQVAVDIVFLDLKMPGLNGLDVFKLLQQQGFAGKVVLMTANGEGDLLEEAKSLGLKKFLIKPFDLAELNQIIEGK